MSYRVIFGGGAAIQYLAMIGTGGDPGHSPARRTYDKADYTAIPLARYFTL